VHTITGAGDMLCRVVARSNADLQRVLDAIVSAEGVVRSATLISLATQVPYRVLPLVRTAATSSRPGGSSETPPARQSPAVSTRVGVGCGVIPVITCIRAEGDHL
jgi:hypothetical protein